MPPTRKPRGDTERGLSNLHWERFLRIETPDYDEHAWCRVEPLLSHVFSFADYHVAIGLDFR
jgi:hypothetical protein